MERVVDSIGGKAVAVVYGAEQFELSRAAGRWARSRQVRREAKRCGATHLLRVEGVGGDHETWWLGQAGVSFAAAIEGWAAQEEDVDDDVVLVPLDDRIYAAELGGGEVEEEMVIGEGVLPEQFRKWRGRTVRAFEAGDLGEVLADTAAALEPLPFDLRAMVYRPSVVGLTAAGLFTPAQAVYGAAVVGLVVGWQFFDAWRAGAVDDAVQASRRRRRARLPCRATFPARRSWTGSRSGSGTSGCCCCTGTACGRRRSRARSRWCIPETRAAIRGAPNATRRRVARVSR